MNFKSQITVPEFCMFVTGAPASGKTNLIKGIVKELVAAGDVQYCYIFSPTAKFSKVGGSYSFVDNKFICSTYSDQKMNNIFKSQVTRIKENKPSKLLIIFDDMMGMYNSRSKTFSQLITNRRHFNIKLIFSSQYAKTNLSPLMRSNVNYIFLFAVDNKEGAKQYVDWWVNDINDINKLNELPEYTFLGIKNGKRTKDKYFYGRTDKISDFKINFVNNKKN